MAEGVYSNFKSFEDTLTGAITLVFSWRPRSITIVNDSSSADLKFKFNASEDFATLKAGETVNPDLRSRQVYLSATDATYRVWGVG